MDWANERYVRVYTRDTVDWSLLPWEARALWLLLLRKLDRAGRIELGRHGARGLAVAVGMPVEVAERALASLLEDGCVQLTDGGTLFAPNFIDAQEAAMSDAQRARASREARRDRARADVTNRDAAIVNRDEVVTDGHTSSPPVTAGHSVPSEPCHAEPTSSGGEPPTVPGTETVGVKPPKKAPRKARTEEDVECGKLLAAHRDAFTARHGSGPANAAGTTTAKRLLKACDGDTAKAVAVIERAHANSRQPLELHQIANSPSQWLVPRSANGRNQQLPAAPSGHGWRAGGAPS